MKAKIGLKSIAAMPPNSIIWDTEIYGLNVRRQFSNVVTYSIVYRTLDGVQRWQRIGRHGVWTPDLARKQARSVLMARDLGKDPSAEKMALRSAPTVDELCDEYEKRDNGKKLATIRADRSRIKVHIKPKLGTLKVASVTSDHVEDLMRRLSDGNKSRVLGLLGAIFSYAVKRKMRSDNPCRGIDKPAETKRTRRLSELEYQQFGKAVNGGGIISDTFLLLSVTGWRSSEAKNLRWAECDLERSIVTLGDTKTGVSVRPLSGAAIEIIKRQKSSSEYVFGYVNGKPIDQPRNHWVKLGMASDVTPHTLRHSYASLAADLGLPDHTIARLLGHSQKSMTSRYIHMEKALIEASDIVAGATLQLMKK